MPPPLRILRAEVQDHLGIQRAFTPRQIKQQNEILGAAEHLWAFHGMADISLAMIAATLCIPTSIIRFYFADEHVVLAEILRRHLINISKALGEWPMHTEDWRYRRCEIYLRATHYQGGLLLPHVLLKRDRHKLPQDLLPTIEQMYSGIITMLGGEKPTNSPIFSMTPSPRWTACPKPSPNFSQTMPNRRKTTAPSQSCGPATPAASAPQCRPTSPWPSNPVI